VAARRIRVRPAVLDHLTGTIGATAKRDLRSDSSSDLHGTDFGDARLRDGRKRFLGADADPGRRVLHLKCSARRVRHAALFPEQYAAYMARTGMLVPRLFRRR
jgi:hypothetical protein